MATLKEHQEAMVQLLANGSGIPASASRLAHAMHDVIEVLSGTAMGRDLKDGYDVRCDATTPGLNDRALAEDIKAVRPKQVSAEQRVKQLENTIRQLKANNAKLKADYASCFKALEDATADCISLYNQLEKLRMLPEQSGVRKEDTQAMCDCGCPFSHYDESRELQICNSCRGVK